MPDELKFREVVAPLRDVKAGDSVPWWPAGTWREVFSVQQGSENTYAYDAYGRVLASDRSDSAITVRVPVAPLPVGVVPADYDWPEDDDEQALSPDIDIFVTYAAACDVFRAARKAFTEAGYTEADAEVIYEITAAIGDRATA